MNAVLRKDFAARPSAVPRHCAGVVLLLSLALVGTSRAAAPEGTAWQCSLQGSSTHTVAVDLAARFPMLVESCRHSGGAAAPVPPPPPMVLAPPAPPMPEIAPPTLIQRYAPAVIADAPRPVLQPPFAFRMPPPNGFASASPYGTIVADAANRHGVDPRLVEAVIRVESAHDPRARSNKGAVGLMQLMPATARRFGVEDSRRLYEPATNIDTGTRYLATLLRMFGDRIDLALAAYNAGEGAVIKYGFRIPPYNETRDYVTKVMGHFERSRGQARSPQR